MTERRDTGKTEPLLVARDINASFADRVMHRGLFGFGRSHASRRQVLFGVSAEVHAGECLAVIGASGSGKTTLTRIMLGLAAADSGSIEYRGEEVGRGSVGSRALRAESSIVFQDPFGSLDPRWTVERSVSEPLWLRRRALGFAVDEVEGKAAQALARVGLDPRVFLGRYPCDLSGGQAQRVAIARAIVANPRLILADEPMSAIDVAARVQILETFQSILSGEGSGAVDTATGQPIRPAIIMVSHDLGVVQHIADRILVLREGHVVESGPTDAVLDNPQSDYTRQLIAAASL
ncbi:ABC transporter ATP-binding protein [Bifidobacterium miconisargentati]|uniref:ABC transporter ATP-binding protein n=1 Tax=Bifidobacterium miconisargentati TaxID=2834437 RepID=UPI003B835AD1